MHALSADQLLLLGSLLVCLEERDLEHRADGSEHEQDDDWPVNEGGADDSVCALADSANIRFEGDEARDIVDDSVGLDEGELEEIAVEHDAPMEQPMNEVLEEEIIEEAPVEAEMVGEPAEEAPVEEIIEEAVEEVVVEEEATTILEVEVPDDKVDQVLEAVEEVLEDTE